MSARLHILTVVFLVTVTFGLPSAAQAQATWYVDDDAPGDPAPGDPSISDPDEDGSAEHPFDAIQEGIDAAVDGDTVLVLDGTYTGDGNRNLEYHGKAITVRSENGPDTCIIDCEQVGRGFMFRTGETADAVVDGLTITNGNVGYEAGGGIYCDSSSPTISNCTITGNRAGDDGGGIACYSGSPSINNCGVALNVSNHWGGGISFRGGSPTIRNCTVTGNTAEHRGAGIYCEQSDATVYECTIINNEATGRGGGICCHDCNPTIEKCVIKYNEGSLGGGVRCVNSSPTIINCVITANVGRSTSGGGGVLCDGVSSPTISNCTITRNTAGSGGGLYCYPSSVPVLVNCILWENDPDPFGGAGVPVVTYCDVQGGWPGEGNIDADPRLTHDRTRLQVDSPCRDTGDPDGDYSGQTDIDGEPRVLDDRVDIGADEWLDTDQDALPDAWEQLYFGSPTDADPLADDDADGVTNLDEYALSRNPFRGPLTFYANLKGSDDWDGLAPAWDGKHGPKATIQAAIDATDRYEGDEVVVADGTYMGAGNKNLDFAGKEIAVRSASGPEKCVIDCEDDGRAFYFHRAETGACIVSGLTLTGASENGIRCESSSPTISQCVITDSGGDGVSCRSSSPMIESCTVGGNAGSGFACTGGNVRISDCVIMWNDGRGILHGGGSLVINKCTIMENGGGGLRSSCANISDCVIVCNDGHGIYIPEGGASSAVNNCTIAANSASWAGGGIYCNSDTLTINNCTIAGNMAQDGAGVYCNSGSPTISNCTITGNTAACEGGAVYCRQHSPMISNCTIAGNVAQDGAGVYCNSGSPTISNCTITGNTAAWGGGGIYRRSGNPAAVNSIIWNNLPNQVSGTSGTATYCDIQDGWPPGDGNIDADPLFVDPDGPDDDPNTFDDNDYRLSAGSPCINAGSNYVPSLADEDMEGNPRVQHCRVDMGAYESAYPPATFEDCNENSVEDDCDVYDGTSEDYDLSHVPDECEDCNGNGVADACDLDCGAGNCASHPLGCGGSNDTNGNGVPDECDCPGDLNHDWRVDIVDLAHVLMNYGTTSGAAYQDGDLDADGDVDLTDLAALLSVFGTMCE